MFRSTATWWVYTHNVPWWLLSRAGTALAVVFAVESHMDMIAHEMALIPTPCGSATCSRMAGATGDGMGTSGARPLCAPPSQPPTGGAVWARVLAGPIAGAASPGTERTVTVKMDEHARPLPYTLVPETGTGAHTVGGRRSTRGSGRGRDRGPEGYGRRSYGCRRAAQQRRRDPCRAGRRPGVRQQLTFLAAECYGWPKSGSSSPAGGRVFVEGDPDQGVPIQEVRASRPPVFPISFAMTTEARA